MRKYVSIGMLLCILLTACREPMSVERFVKGEGPYTFFVDMSDSTSAYDFDLYTRVDAPVDTLKKLAALPLQVTWTSPTFHVFREDVYLPMDGKMSLFSKQVRAPYRAAIKPDEWGPWQLVVRVQNPPEGLCGMGLVVTRKKD